MRISDSGPAHIFQLAERRMADNPDLARLVEGITSGIAGLETSNRDLEQRNAALELELVHARGRSAMLEGSLRQQTELIGGGLGRIAQNLLRVEETMEALHRSAGSEALRRFSEATHRIMELQRDVLTQLEAALGAIVCRDQAVHHEAAQSLREAQGSIVELADHVRATAAGLAVPIVGDASALLGGSGVIDLPTSGAKSEAVN